METFADYILSEKDWIKKMEIMHYLKQKTGIFFDKSVVFKTYLAKTFLDNTKPLMEYYEDKNKLHKINVNRNVEDIFKDIVEVCND